MPLKIIKRGNRYWLRGTVRGEAVYETTGVTLAYKEEAEAVRVAREAGIIQRSVYGPATTVTFREAAITYCETVDPKGVQRRMILGHEKQDGTRSWNLIDRIGSKKLSEINQELIDTLARQQYEDAAPSTIQRNLVTPITSVMKHAAKRDWCKVPAFDRPKPSQSRIRWLTPDEARRLVGASADHLAPLLTFLLGTGARLSEALDLEWTETDLQDARAYFWKTKGGLQRSAGLPPSVVSALANLDHREGAVFRTWGGKPYRQGREYGGQIKTAFSGALKRSGVNHITPHGLRHTWASWFYASSKDILLLKAEGGWKTLSQVERYAHLVPQRYLPGIRDMWGGYHPAIRAESVQSIRQDRKNSA